MYRNLPPRFRKTLFALAIGAALAPQAAQALDLSQSPPGTKEPYVAPNVILSLDDSGSMAYKMATGSTTNGSSTINAPNGDGTWSADARRDRILRHSVIDVFSDTTLLPDGKIRLAWQIMNATASNSTNACGMLLETADATKTTTSKGNVMRVLSGPVGTAGGRDTSTSRGRFLACMDNFSASGSTYTHRMVSRAHDYMTAPLHDNGPWAAVPGTPGGERLSCRRNYHIVLTDGGWNAGFLNVPAPAVDSPTNYANYDNNTRALPDGTQYNAAASQTRVFRDMEPASTSPSNNLNTTTRPPSTIADWSLYSWSTALQNPANMSPAGRTNQNAVQPARDYTSAPAQETFTSPTGATATLDRYWNPRYDPATWPHLATYTIGFSGDSVPRFNYTTDSGTCNAYQSVITEPISKVPYGYDGNFADYANNTFKWRAVFSDCNGTGNGSSTPKYVLGGADSNRGLDMWHAAINGRGRFYQVTQSEDLKKAFQDIIGKIIVDNEPNINSAAVSGSNSTRNPVGMFAGGYWPDQAWKGSVKASTVDAEGAVTPIAGWDTAARLDVMPPTNRQILTWNEGGVSFRWSSLSTAQKGTLGLAVGNPGYTLAVDGSKILDYIRGDRSLEGSAAAGYTAAKPFRERKSVQGDIVNSAVWYTGAPASGYSLKGYTTFIRDKKDRTPMVYVGGNDGMLHGFDATELGGNEKIAYVPRGVIPSLKLLAGANYDNEHRYFVDGSPMTGDVDLNSHMGGGYTANWHTLLVGTLGAGGKGYFVLDVTNPTDFAESGAASLVKLDRTRGASEAQDCASLTGTEQTVCEAAAIEDADIGHITASPVVDNASRSTQITRMNNGRWAVVMGNGYNSANQRPVLLIQYLDGDQKLVRIPATGNPDGSGMDPDIATDNGLSAPRLVDLNGDGRPDVAYAGDNLGNMWKFDLTSDDPEGANKWKVAFGGQPLYTAKGPSVLNDSTRTNAQPITAPPTVRANDRKMTVTVGGVQTLLSVGGMMVTFGTGRNVTENDPGSVQVQTLYSVLDNTRYKLVSSSWGKRPETILTASGTCPSANCIPAPAPIAATDALAEQKVVALDGDFGTLAPKNAANDLNPNTWANFKGWFLDFPEVGERLLKPMSFYSASNILAVFSQVPASGSDSSIDVNVESCDSASVNEERQFLTLINIMDGKPPSIQIMDKNGDGLFDLTTDQGASRRSSTKGPHFWIKRGGSLNTDVDSSGNTRDDSDYPEQSQRPNWRQPR